MTSQFLLLTVLTLVGTSVNGQAPILTLMREKYLGEACPTNDIGCVNTVKRCHDILSPILPDRTPAELVTTFVKCKLEDDEIIDIHQGYPPRAEEELHDDVTSLELTRRYVAFMEYTDGKSAGAAKKMRCCMLREVKGFQGGKFDHTPFLQKLNEVEHDTGAKDSFIKAISFCESDKVAELDACQELPFIRCLMDKCVEDIVKTKAN